MAAGRGAEAGVGPGTDAVGASAAEGAAGRLRVGVVGAYGTVAQHVTLAREAEQHGWDGFFTWDGIAIGPMDTWDPWVLLGAAACATERVTLGALVFALPRRRPWEVARQTVTVDHLSGGRLVLPVGLGVNDDGGASRVGSPPPSVRERAERLDEHLEILRRAWTGEAFSFHGTHHVAEDLVLAPPPVQRPRIPVWPVAAVGRPRSMARAARWDGAVLQTAGVEVDLTPEQVDGAVRWLRERREADGVDPAAPFDVVCHGTLPADPSAAEARLRELADAGATWWVEAAWDPATATPEATLAQVRQGPPRP